MMSTRTRPLTLKQQAFVEHYLKCWNATEAARQVGYAVPRQEGSRLLSNAVIARAIKERLEELKVSSDEVLIRLGDHARSTMADFVDPTQLPPVFKTAAESGKLHLVKKVTHTRRFYKGELVEEKTDFELYDAQAALVHLGKHHALFTDRLRVDDWRSEAIGLIRDGKLTYPALAEEFGDDLARELFKSAGVPVASA